MLVHICDRCHNKISRVRFVIHGFEVIVDGENKYHLEDKEFCSLHCQDQYIISGMKGRGLDDHITV